MPFALMLALVLQGAAAQSPVRDAAPRQSGGGATIRGRVTAAATHEPLHRVRITLSSPAGSPLTTVTDTRGVFEIADVPAGSYSLTAARGGYLTMQYGQRRPRENGRTFEIKYGDVVEGVNLELYRGGVVSGRILDESGDAAPGVRVEALDARYVRGRRVTVASRIAFTNDAGEYRLSGLEPGSYQLRASSTDVWQSDDGKATYVFAATWYPGVTARERPDALNVAVGQEMSGVDLTLIPGRAARVSGLLVDASGQPLPEQVVNLDVITRTTGGAIQSAGFGGTTTTDARGAFEFAKLAPGEYNAIAGGQNDRTAVSVTVADGESKQIVITPGRAPGVSGLVVTDDGKLPAFAATRLQIEPVSAAADSVLPTWNSPRSMAVKPDWTFALVNMEGEYLFRTIGLPDGWMVKAVTLGGRDVTDSPVTIARGVPDVQGLQVVVSQKGGAIDGTIADRDGTPVPDVTVVAFAEDRARWGLASRFIRTARPDGKGHFSIAGLPPGTYRLAARDAVVAGQWEDTEFLESLMKETIRIELGEGAKATVKLTLEPPR